MVAIVSGPWLDLVCTWSQRGAQRRSTRSAPCPESRRGGIRRPRRVVRPAPRSQPGEDAGLHLFRAMFRFVL